MRLARTGEQRLWLPFGAVAEVALVNKQPVLVLLLGLTIGVIATLGWRPVSAGRWMWADAGLALVLWLPVLVRQAEHGWPQLDIAGQIRTEYGTTSQRVGFVVLQLVLFSLGATILWLAGIVWAWRQPDRRYARVLVWSWAVVLVVFLVTAGQAYYPAGTYPGLIAAGAGPARQRRRLRWIVLGVGAATLARHAPGSPARPARRNPGPIGVVRTRRGPTRNGRLARARGRRLLRLPLPADRSGHRTEQSVDADMDHRTGESRHQNRDA